MSDRFPNATPRELGYRMPAEWEPHEATWLAWPHNPEDWPGKFQTIPWLYAEIVRLLSAHERVHLLVDDAKAQQRATGILERAGANLDQVSFHTLANQPRLDPRLRPDLCSKCRRPGCHDQLALQRLGQVLRLASRRRAAGPWERIRSVFPRGSLSRNRDARRSRLVLEGGSIDTNGEGILLTTEECLLSEVQQRNPGVSREQMEHAFHDYLGIDQVIWLNRGIAGDDTHGHVDDITPLRRAGRPS